MQRAAPSHPTQEIELKLALPTRDPAGLAKRLARVPILARRKPTQQPLHNVYFDTPDERLHHQRTALRIRRVGSDAHPQWLQTLKTSQRSDSALSQRGEWEVPVPSAALAWDALQATPWPGMDPDGSVFRALAPVFATQFERTCWTVRRRDGSVIEVALDLGHIVAGAKTTPICELELELLAGQPAALFEVAQQIASTIAVLPFNTSKAERGYALAQGSLDAALNARPPKLKNKLTLPAAAACVLREMFSQFTTNLNALRSSDDPEVVHQARVGWRRFRSALRLFKPALAEKAAPPWQALQPLLDFLGELRDLDVAGTDTLPPLADAYAAGDARRAQAWQAMAQALLQATQLQRKSVRYALQTPAVGAILLAITQWLEELSAPHAPGDAAPDEKVSLKRWSRRRISRQHRQLKTARKYPTHPDAQHRTRILAKRLRYSIEVLRTFLPRRRAKRWYQQAANLQLHLGAARDAMQAATLVKNLEADAELVEFLRGIAVGKQKL